MNQFPPGRLDTMGASSNMQAIFSAENFPFFSYIKRNSFPAQNFSVFFNGKFISGAILGKSWD
jgi:hypothetical protein